MWSCKKITALFSVAFVSLLLMVSTEGRAAEKKIWSYPKPDSAKQYRSDGLHYGQLRNLPSTLDVAGSFIVGGTTASRNEFPEYTMLLVDGHDGYLYFICGASLLTSNKVLTAAHCTRDFPISDLWAIPGHYADSDVTAGDFQPIANKAIHPGYNSNTFNADISILTLSASVSGATAKIFGGDDQLAGYTGTVVGMGQLRGGDYAPVPSVLQKVWLPIVSNAACSQVWTGITPNMLCAGGTSSGGIGACSGDSGGPLFTTYKGRRVQAGIVSWGHIDCAQPGYYDVYARTSALISFIKQHAPGALIVTGGKFSIAPIMMLLGD